jgi:hypothetical protein
MNTTSFERLLKVMPEGQRVTPAIDRILRIAERSMPLQISEEDLAVAARYGLSDLEVLELGKSSRRASNSGPLSEAGYALGIFLGVYGNPDEEYSMGAYLQTIKNVLARTKASHEEDDIDWGDAQVVSILKRVLFGYAASRELIHLGTPTTVADVAREAPATLYPVFHIQNASDQGEKERFKARVVAQLEAYRRENKVVARVVIVSDDDTLASRIGARWKYSPIDTVAESDGVYDPLDQSYSFDAVVSKFPQKVRFALAQDHPAGVIPLFSPVIASWTVTDPMLRRATILLQLLGDKLVRVGVDMLDAIRKAGHIATQA